jgi:hypothetical protein
MSGPRHGNCSDRAWKSNNVKGEGTIMTAEESSVTEWLRLIQAEYLEIPGLRLTKPQVQRLWGLDPRMCDALLDRLMATNFLMRTRRDAYVLASAGQ